MRVAVSMVMLACVLGACYGQQVFDLSVPNFGFTAAGGATVTVTGSGFFGNWSVTLNGGETFPVLSSDTMLVLVTSPFMTATNTIVVAATNGTHTASCSPSTCAYAATVYGEVFPTYPSVPATGHGGLTLEGYGFGFDPSAVTVSYAEVSQCTPTFANGTHLICSFTSSPYIGFFSDLGAGMGEFVYFAVTLDRISFEASYGADEFLVAPVVTDLEFPIQHNTFRPTGGDVMTIRGEGLFGFYFGGSGGIGEPCFDCEPCFECQSNAPDHDHSDVGSDVAPSAADTKREAWHAAAYQLAGDVIRFGDPVSLSDITAYLGSTECQMINETATGGFTPTDTEMRCVIPQFPNVYNNSIPVTVMTIVDGMYLSPHMFCVDESNCVATSLPPAPPTPPAVEGCTVGCTLGADGGIFGITGTDMDSATLELLVNGEASTEVNGTSGQPVRRRLLQVSGGAGENVTTRFYSIAGGLSDGYPTMTLSDSPNNVSVDITGLLFVDAEAVANNCAMEGAFWTGTECIWCPTGGYCPGGARVWPLRYYWSPAETEQPGACTLDEACCGAMGEVGSCPVRQRSDGSRDTQRCDEELGYAGEYCTECMSGYYRDDTRCLPCNSDNDVEFSLLLITAFVMMVLVMIGVTFLRVSRLTGLVSILLALQQFVFVGRNASAHLNGDRGRRLQDFFRSISFLLFDIEFLKPTCYIAAESNFADLYLGMLAIVAIAACFFLVGAVLYVKFGHRIKCCKACQFDLCKKKDKKKRLDKDDMDLIHARELGGDLEIASESPSAEADTFTGDSDLSSGASRSSASEQQNEQVSVDDYVRDYYATQLDDESITGYTTTEMDPGDEEAHHALTQAEAKRKLAEMAQRHQRKLSIRALTAVIMLGTAVYFQVSLRTIQALHCVEVQGEQVLAVEMSTRCYEGAHGRLLIVAWPVLAIYVVGFPLVLSVIMIRAFLQRRYLLLKDAFAFLTRGLRVRFFWFRLVSLLMMLSLAVESTVISEPSLKIFMLAISFLVNVVLVGWLWPFKVDANNIFQIALGLGAGAQVALFLNSGGFAREEDKDLILQIVLIVLLVLALLFVILYRWYKMRQNGTTISCCSCADCFADDDDNEEWVETMEPTQRKTTHAIPVVSTTSSSVTSSSSTPSSSTPSSSTPSSSTPSTSSTSSTSWDYSVNVGTSGSYSEHDTRGRKPRWPPPEWNKRVNEKIEREQRRREEAIERLSSYTASAASAPSSSSLSSSSS